MPNSKRRKKVIPSTFIFSFSLIQDYDLADYSQSTVITRLMYPILCITPQIGSGWQISYQPSILSPYRLNHSERLEEGSQYLRQAARYSSDPMIRYVLAKNEQEAGNYLEAERLLLHAIDILPERIYPYYLLANLYAEPDFYQPDKRQEMADSVWHKKPKVESQAIREMREKVKEWAIRKD